MKQLIGIVLIAVALYFAVTYRNELKRQERERKEQALGDCWRNVAPNSKEGAELCYTLAKQLEAE